MAFAVRRLMSLGPRLKSPGRPFSTTPLGQGMSISEKIYNTTIISTTFGGFLFGCNMVHTGRCNSHETRHQRAVDNVLIITLTTTCGAMFGIISPIMVIVGPMYGISYLLTGDSEPSLEKE